MDCLKPVAAWDFGLNADGKHIIRFKPMYPMQESNIVFPCGKCSACRLNKRNLWIRRCNAELLTCPQSSFITLTFDDAHCPPSVCKRDLQSFFKRLRNFFRDFMGISKPLPLRYFAVGEYGHLKHRPHYHAIVFGVDFYQPQFKPYLVGCKDGYPLYSSKVLEHYWPFGYVTFDEVTPSNVRYVAKYVNKSDDGVCVFSQGLGRSLFVDFVRRGRSVDVSPKSLLFSSAVNDSFCDTIGKAPSRFPRYALRYLERFYPDTFNQLKVKRKEFLRGRKEDYTPPSVKEYILNEKSMAEKDKRNYEKYH